MDGPAPPPCCGGSRLGVTTNSCGARTVSSPSWCCSSWFWCCCLFRLRARSGPPPYDRLDLRRRRRRRRGIRSTRSSSRTPAHPRSRHAASRRSFGRPRGGRWTESSTPATSTPAPRATAGQTVAVWIGPGGEQAPPPRSGAANAAEAVATALVVWVAGTAGCAAVFSAFVAGHETAARALGPGMGTYRAVPRVAGGLRLAMHGVAYDAAAISDSTADTTVAAARSIDGDMPYPTPTSATSTP